MTDTRELTRRYGIGLTGGIACGKSTAAFLLKAHGLHCVDADELARNLTRRGGAAIPFIEAKFGSDVLLEDGSLNRKKMADRIFKDPAQKEILEQILHPLIEDALHSYLQLYWQNHAQTYFIYEASLLFEKNRTQDFRQIWVAHCPPFVQIQRLMQRDQLSEKEALLRLESQWDPMEKKRLAHTVFETGEPWWDLLSQVQKAVQSLHLLTP